MARNKKKRRGLNLGTIVFLVMVIYLTGYVFTYLDRDKLAIYEVSESDIKDTIEGAGIIIRDEEVVPAVKTGYISPYIKDGSKVKKGGTIYTVDTTGKIQEFVKEIAGQKSDTSVEEKKNVISDLCAFEERYTDNRFYEVYDAKNDIYHDLTAYTDTIMAKNKETFIEKYGADSYSEVASESAGIISFQSDGMEGITTDTITKDDFHGKNNMQDLRSSDTISQDTPVYRIIKSQVWRIVMELSQDEYLKLKEIYNKGTTTVNVGFDKDDFRAMAEFECYMKDNTYYVELTFDKYVQRYMNQRYLWIELILSEADGLIVPTSSIVLKEGFKVPITYIAKKDGDNKNSYIYVKKREDDVDVYELTQVEIIKQNTSYAYIKCYEVEAGNTITKKGGAAPMELDEKVKVRGVYVVNQGYANFQTVELKQRTEDYCILFETTSNIQLYDRIILHSDAISENQLIY